MSELQIFKNETFGEIRSIIKDSEPWFVGKDVAMALGYSNASKAISVHVDDEDKDFIMLDIADTQNGNVPIGKTKTAFINESGLYSLILSSKLPKAREFKRWVTSEVLPSIRKTGSYSVQREVTPYQEKLLDVREKEINFKIAELWTRLGDRTSIPEYKQITDSYASQVLAGKPVLPLPEITQKTYTATEIGNMLGISKNKVGSLATKFNLKTNEFGKWFYDKSPYSAKQVETFRYYENVVPKLRELM